MEQLLKNAKEFLESGEDNLKKNRLNVAASDFFKSIVINCDYLIYEQIRRIPKNHNDRFNLLKVHLPKIYLRVSKLFQAYIKSYNLSVTHEETIKLMEFANELKNLILDKK